MARGNKLMPLTLVVLVIAAALTLDAQAAWAASCGGTQGTALRLGCDNNTSTDTTVINYPTNSTTALYVHATGSGGLAVNGRGTYGISGVGDVTGTAGQGGTFGVYGTSPKTAVYGHGGTYGVFGAAATCVYGTSAQGCVLLGGCGAGVSGTNTSNGFGVFGSSANDILPVPPG